MAYELKSAGKIPKIGEISYAEAPFDIEIGLFKKNKPRLRLITGENLAYARIKSGKDSYFSDKGSWIIEGCLYVPKTIAGKPTIILLRNSLILSDPKKAVESSRKTPFYYRIDDYKAASILEKRRRQTGHRPIRRI